METVRGYWDGSAKDKGSGCEIALRCRLRSRGASSCSGRWTFFCKYGTLVDEHVEEAVTDTGTGINKRRDGNAVLFYNYEAYERVQCDMQM